MIYSQSESIIKSYDYCQSQERGLFAKAKGPTTQKLYVTNKRIVSVTQNKEIESRDEVFLKDVSSVSSFVKTKKSRIWILFAILAAVFLIATIALLSAEAEDEVLIPVLCFLAFGALAVWKFLKPKVGTQMYINFYCKFPKNEIMNVSCGNITGWFNLFRRKNAVKTFRVTIDPAIATSMVEEIGALLAQYNSSSVVVASDVANEAAVSNN